MSFGYEREHLGGPIPGDHVARRPVIIPVLLGTISIVLLPVATNVASSVLPSSWQRYSWLSWPVVGVCALLALVGQIGIRNEFGLRVGHSDEPNPVLSLLAGVIKGRLTDEATVQGLNRPHPLDLRWMTTDRPIASPWPDAEAAVVGGGARGNIDDIVVGLRQRHFERLVVVGGPGAGKTVLMMQLSLRMIEERAAPDPVPVIFQVATWNPAREPFHVWLGRRLRTDYGFLVPESIGPALVQALVRDQMILPILDGLDELPEPLRVLAIDAIDRWHGPRPIVITCRTEEYEDLVRSSARVFPGARVLEIEPIQPRDTVAFLAARFPVKSPRWQPLFDHLLEHDKSPCALALSTPLMVALARTVYDGPNTDPGELADETRFPDKEAVERHLLDAFVGSVYVVPGWPADWPGHKVGRKPRPGSVPRWLGFLATHLQRGRTYDLSLWDLRRAIHPADFELVTNSLLSVIAATAFGTMFTLAFGSTEAALEGVFDGLAISMVAAVMLGLTDRQPTDGSGVGRLGHWALTTVAQSLIGGCLIGAAVAADRGPVPGLEAGLGATLVLWLVIGPMLGLARGLGRAIQPLRRPRDHDSFSSRLRTLFGQFACAVAVALTFNVPLGVLVAVEQGAVAGVAAFGSNFTTIGLLSALLLGLGVVGRRGVPERVHVRHRGGLTRLLRHVRRGLILGAVYGLAIGPSFGAASAATAILPAAMADRPLLTDGELVVFARVAALAAMVGLVAGLMRELARWLNAPVDLVASPSPLQVVRSARTAAFVWAGICVGVLQVMVLVGVKIGSRSATDPATYLTAYGLSIGVVGGCLAILGSVWGELVLIRVILAIRGRVPWRLLTFLNDGRVRGVFRLSGATYQFRHARLQERLASVDTAPVAPVTNTQSS
jgi:hypothetical protein